jgi:hypothetical protein
MGGRVGYPSFDSFVAGGTGTPGGSLKWVKEPILLLLIGLVSLMYRTLSVLGALEDEQVVFGQVGVQEALLERWAAQRPTLTTTADVLSTVLGLDSVHTITDRMPAALHPPEQAIIDGLPAIRFWAASDGENMIYHQITVVFPTDGAPLVQWVCLD